MESFVKTSLQHFNDMSQVEPMLSYSKLELMKVHMVHFNSSMPHEISLQKYATLCPPPVLKHGSNHKLSSVALQLAQIQQSPATHPIAVI